MDKIEYLWMYYKSWLAAAICVAVAVYLGVTMYRGMQENVVLNVAIVGGSSQETEQLQKEFEKYAGITAKHDTIKVQANIPADGGSVTSKTALTTLIGANAVDVMICPEDIYEEYTKQDGFEVLEKEPGATVKGDGVVMENNDYLRDIAGVPYEKAYMGVLVNAQHKEMAYEFIKFLQAQ